MEPDELQLRRLARSYATAVDRREVEALLELFLPDARLSVVRGDEVGEEYRGHDEIPAIIDRLAECDATMHEVVNHHLELEGNRAAGEVSGVAHHVTGSPGGGAKDLVLYGRYRDRYALDGSRWRFASRRLVVAWTELRRVRLPDGERGHGG